MKIDQSFKLKPQMQAAVDELAGTIAASYPSAQLQVTRHPEESTTILLEATVDIDDTDQVVDLVFERMEQLRIDEGVPILVMPLRTPERVARLLDENRVTTRATVPTSFA